eukprot:Amastigsp_a346152_14.p4 type:complete len:110 gc:universal Amastigsp_a346152_14:491-820(+)
MIAKTLSLQRIALFLVSKISKETDCMGRSTRSEAFYELLDLRWPRLVSLTLRNSCVEHLYLIAMLAGKRLALPQATLRQCTPDASCLLFGTSASSLRSTKPRLNYPRHI